jgi:hypothetical protein
VTGNYCQCGFYCRLCYGCYQPAFFGIYDSDTKEFRIDNIVGKVIKEPRSTLNISSMSEYFKVIFPSSATPDDKYNLICAALTLAFIYYVNDTDRVNRRN